MNNKRIVKDFIGGTFIILLWIIVLCNFGSEEFKQNFLKKENLIGWIVATYSLFFVHHLIEEKVDTDCSLCNAVIAILLMTMFCGFIISLVSKFILIFT